MHAVAIAPADPSVASSSTAPPIGRQTGTLRYELLQLLAWNHSRFIGSRYELYLLLQL